MSVITNPILKGFNPDPSIVRVGDDYYIATSTFEWFPGIQIHHSTDLQNWKLIARPLKRTTQVDLKGVPDSCGVWAPCLSYDKGIFYLVYSNVKSFDGAWKDIPNYLVTATDISGEWSDPVFLNAMGFDGSLFHDDDDGRKWYLSMVNDHRKLKIFGGIILQEFDVIEKKLKGLIYNIFKGSSLGITEGPHLYKKDGYYYLLTAEGGTEYGHAATISRSKSITGPYTIGPNNPLISSRNHPDYYLQKCGHADLVQTKDGNWLTVFLTARPLTPRGLCILGRETSIETVNWDNDQWPVLGSGNCMPRIEVTINAVPQKNDTPIFEKDDFDGRELNINFQSLRIPITEDWASLRLKKGFLCLFGRESLSSTHEQSLLARRIQSLRMTASASLDFSPENFQQMAGLVCYYNTANFHYLHVTANDNGERCLQIITHDNHKHIEAFDIPILLPVTGTVYLQAELNGADLQFYYALMKDNWIKAGPLLNAGILSDDYIRESGSRYQAAFTGAFVGICCQDLSGNKKKAWFDWFNYKEEEYHFISDIKME